MRPLRFAPICLLMVALGGCRSPRNLSLPIDGTPGEIVDAIRAKQAQRPMALQASYGVSLSGPEFSGSTRGGMVVHRPDQLRIEILSPFNTPLAYIASDGTALHAWLQQERTFYRGDDVAAVVENLIGGAADIGDIVDLLTAALPLDDARIIGASYDAERALLQVILEGPDRTALHAQIDPRGGLVRQLALKDDADAVLIQVDYPDYVQVEAQDLPRRIEMDFPVFGWQIDLKVSSWNVLGQIPDVFTLAPPPGAREKDLVTSLEEMARRQRP
ncbi:MAG: hypothetical protein AAFV53_29715 [Myxococcota bacterium]